MNIVPSLNERTTTLSSLNKLDQYFGQTQKESTPFFQILRDSEECNTYTIIRFDQNLIINKETSIHVVKLTQTYTLALFIAVVPVYKILLRVLDRCGRFCHEQAKKCRLVRPHIA